MHSNKILPKLLSRRILKMTHYINNLFTHRPIQLFVRPCVCSSIRPCVCSSIRPSVRLSVHSSICIPALSDGLYVCLSVCTSTCLSIDQSVCSFVRSSVYLFVIIWMSALIIKRGSRLFSCICGSYGSLLTVSLKSRKRNKKMINHARFCSINLPYTFT